MARTPTASGNSDASKSPADPTTDPLAATQEETIDRIAREANENLRKGRSHMARNPLKTVGIAGAVGALLSTWIRR